MRVNEVRQAFLEFFKDKGHAIVPSGSIMPENDPTTLFTGSGMQPMLSYLLGEKHPQGAMIVDAQKCFRAQDIDEVGDNRHTTMFEMLGNWSLGAFFKEKQIPWMFEFLTQRLELDPTHLYVTVFRGNDSLGIPRDTESVALWKEAFQSVGVEAKDIDSAEQEGMKDGRIFYYGEKKNWWSRSGTPDKMPVGEPGGPDTEMFWDFGAELKLHEQSSYKDEPCHVNCDCGRFMEIGNNVFMEYRKTDQGFERLAQRNVDFGGGLERITAALANNQDIFSLDSFLPLMQEIERLSGKKYGTNSSETRAFRIIADHVRAATFVIGDQRGVVPSNVGQGYVVRRLLRRAIREGRRLDITEPFVYRLAEAVVQTLGSHYTELAANRERIIDEMKKEEEKFGKTLEKGMKELEKMMGNESGLSGEQAFLLFSSYGFPLELTEEILLEKGQTIDRETFASEFKKHQELSRTASAGVFKGGLADHSAETTRLHTATHLRHRALKNVLGAHVDQSGSNITPDRLRFDFVHPTKVTHEQLQQVEEMVNTVIAQDLPVQVEEMSVDEAKQRGAIGLFEEKYGDKITVYSVGQGEQNFSKEICGGPHVTHTGELGSFKVQKEEAVSAGVRRIKASVTGPAAG